MYFLYRGVEPEDLSMCTGWRDSSYSTGRNTPCGRGGFCASFNNLVQHRQESRLDKSLSGSGAPHQKQGPRWLAGGGRRLNAKAAIILLPNFLTSSRVAGALIALTVCFGLLFNHGVAGGSDSYGYVEPGHFWLDGGLQLPQREARQAPHGRSLNGRSRPLDIGPRWDGTSIVPGYAPGLPIMMAAFKAIAGQCAVAWVVPLCGGLLVAATFGIGRRIFSDQKSPWLGRSSLPRVPHFCSCSKSQ